MSRSVDFLPAAYDDLVNIAGYFVSQSPELGERFLTAVRESTDQIGAQPEIGGRCIFPDLRLPHLRVWPVRGFRRYLLIYQVDSYATRIVRLLDGTSDWMNYLTGKTN